GRKGRFPVSSGAGPGSGSAVVAAALCMAGPSAPEPLASGAGSEREHATNVAARTRSKVGRRTSDTIMTGRSTALPEGCSMARRNATAVPGRPSERGVHVHVEPPPDGVPERPGQVETDQAVQEADADPGR